MPERQRVLVCGSRHYGDKAAVEEFVKGLDPQTVIVAGGAWGPDTMVKEAAEARGIGVEVYLPDWGRDGIRAGFLRNLRMLEADVDHVVGFWDGQSRGTAHTLREARKRGLPVTLYRQRAPGTLF